MLEFNVDFVELGDVGEELEALFVPALERGCWFWARKQDAMAEHVKAMKGLVVANIEERTERRSG